MFSTVTVAAVASLLALLVIAIALRRRGGRARRRTEAFFAQRDAAWGGARLTSPSPTAPAATSQRPVERRPPDPAPPPAAEAVVDLDRAGPEGPEAPRARPIPQTEEEPAFLDLTRAVAAPAPRDAVIDVDREEEPERRVTAAGAGSTPAAGAARRPPPRESPPPSAPLPLRPAGAEMAASRDPSWRAQRAVREMLDDIAPARPEDEKK